MHDQILSRCTRVNPAGRKRNGPRTALQNRSFVQAVPGWEAKTEVI